MTQIQERYGNFWAAYRATAEAAGLPRDHHRAEWNGEALYIEGRAGFDRFGLVVRKNRWWVEYSIETDDSERTIARFRLLFDQRQMIEAAFGEALDWTMSKNRKRGLIRSAAYDSGVVTRTSDWPGLQAKMQGTMLRLLEAIRPVRGEP